jgi:hypothetical protein
MVTTNSDEVVLFKCECVDYHYLQVGYYDWGDDLVDFYVAIIEEPPGFWRKLKCLFEHRSIASEVLLRKDRAAELHAILEKYLNRLK